MACLSKRKIWGAKINCCVALINPVFQFFFPTISKPLFTSSASKWRRRIKIPFSCLSFWFYVCSLVPISEISSSKPSFYISHVWAKGAIKRSTLLPVVTCIVRHWLAAFYRIVWNSEFSWPEVSSRSRFLFRPTQLKVFWPSLWLHFCMLPWDNEYIFSKIWDLCSVTCCESVWWMLICVIL